MYVGRDAVAGLAVGVVAAAVAVGFGGGTALVEVPDGLDVPAAELLVDLAFVATAFAVGAGAAFVALRHRVVVPLVTFAGLVVVPGAVGWGADRVLVAVLAVGPLVVVSGIVETVGRARLGRLRNPPVEAWYGALSIGVMAAVVYAGAFAVRAAVPLWREAGGAAPVGSGAEGLALLLWYVLGVSLVLVGLPAALNRRFTLLAPLVGLVAYLLVDFAYLQPAVAGGAEFVDVLLFVGWPALASLLAGVAAVEWRVRERHGEYDEPDDDAGGGGRGGEGEDDGDGGFSVEGGLFGDRV